MYLRHRPYGIEIRTPAKLNLFFEIVSKRTDGFHNVETLMTPINLYDTLYFKNSSTEQVELDCHWACGLESDTDAAGDLPETEDNLVYQALQLVRQRAGIRSGVVCKIVKQIPSASGLGGASSDAAAALMAASVCWKLNWSTDQLCEVAAELGSDVPFFIHGKTAVCRGRGEKIEIVGQMPRLNFVVVRPPVGLSTAEVYRQVEVPKKPQQAENFVNLLSTKNEHKIGKHLCNRLEASAAKMTSWITRLRESFSRIDCIGHQMSGSGSSYFGIFRNMRQAQRSARLLASRGVGKVYVVQNLN